MKNILKWIGISFVSLIAVGGVSLAAMMHHPSPEDVCAHLSEVLAKQAKVSGAPTAAAFSPTCVDDLRPPKYGKLPYAKRMRCLDSAEDADSIKACSRR